MYSNKINSINILQIGSGNIQSEKFSFKAKGLDLAAKKNIFVPKAYLLPHEILNQFESSSFQNSSLIRQIQDLPIRNSFSIRSAFAVEDQKESSLAGMFETVVSVDKKNPEQIIDAIKKVLESSKRVRGGFRKDILIMEMVAAKFSGIAFTESEYQDDWINWTRGLGPKLVSGEVSGEVISIPKSRNWDFMQTQNQFSEMPQFYSRLQRLLKNVRTVFSEKEWDIEWADDGNKCWLLQVRPITSPLARNDWFGLCNHKEILPELPSVFMNSLINECSPQLFSFYHRIDSELPKKRLMVESFRGRSYFNLSLLADMLRKWGLPTKLLSESMGGVLDSNYSLNLGRVISSWRVYLKLFFLQINALKKSKSGIKSFQVLTKERSKNISELIQKSKTAYISLVHQMLSLTMVMGGPIAFLRFMKTLNDHSIDHITPGTRILKDLDPFFRIIKNNPLIKKSLLKGQIPKDNEFLKLWESYLKDHGHRGVYESDLSQPRFRENYGYILKLLSVTEPSKKNKTKYKLRTLLTLPIWFVLKKFIFAREYTRYEAMKAFEKIRSEWLEHEKSLQFQKLIPSNASIWNFTLKELSEIEQENKCSDDFYQKRIDAINKNRSYVLPDNLKRKTFLEPFVENAEENILKKTFSGMGLAGGKIEGTAWVLNKPNIELPQSFHKQTTILIAPAVDAGWIPTFSQVSGVAVDTGGDLSHGSIILRELGIPAITNATGVYQYVKTGDKVSLMADQGVLLKI